jgi:hypothetical protein
MRIISMFDIKVEHLHFFFFFYFHYKHSQHDTEPLCSGEKLRHDHSAGTEVGVANPGVSSVRFVTQCPFC